MKELIVNTGRSYPIKIERGLLNQAGSIIRTVSSAARAAIVTDSNIAPLYAERLRSSLEAEGFAVSVFVFEAGEEQKRLSTVAQMYDHFLEHSLSRTDLVVALGGGVTGDMAGFAAATYLRGIDFVQIPTSLLAQVDSSVGGKTGVDVEAGKNLVGAFWQPLLVLIDPDTLDTLPTRYFADGMAEVIKYGCIQSASLFKKVAAGKASQQIEEVIYECVDIKRRVVENDERDTGERMLLNFGHTMGHALEKRYQYQTLSHGEAVGIGMVMMSTASERQGLTESGCAGRIAEALKAYGLPVSDPTPLQELAAAASTDKKNAGNVIRLVLLKEIGESYLHTIPRAGLYDFLTGGAQR